MGALAPVLCNSGGYLSGHPSDDNRKDEPMGTFTTSTQNGRTDPAAIAATDAVMRATGILALMGVAIIHLVQLVPTFRATPLLGVSFVALIMGALVVGAPLLGGHPSPRRTWLPVAGLGAAAVAGYIFTRVVSTPIDNQDVGNWSCMLGMAALFVEVGLVGLSAFAVTSHQRRLQTATIPRAKDVPEQSDFLEHVLPGNGSRN
jgi:hypothetical protein